MVTFWREDEAGAARRAADPADRGSPHLRFVLPDRVARVLGPELRHPGPVLWRLRGQRPDQADDDDRELQLRRERILGALQRRVFPGRADQRSLQTGRELPDLRLLPLTGKDPA